MYIYNMKNKIRNLLFIVFLCMFIYPFIYYFIKNIESFTDKSPYGQWELVLRQSFNDQFNISPFQDNISININSLYDEYGNINEPNYYNKVLYDNYDFSTNRILKLNYYDKYESTAPNTITWMQDNSSTPMIINIDNSTLPTDFKGLVKSDISYVFKGYSTNVNDEIYILGASTAYLNHKNINYIPGYGNPNTMNIEKVELYLWNPRPSSKNTFNGNYKNLKISKVDMNDTNNKNFWNKSQDISGVVNDTNNSYSYCFGKLKCNNNMFTPIENDKGYYKPYCDSDSSLNPVYCEGSALYNTNNETSSSVSIGSLNFDMMGKFAKYVDISYEEYFNLFRGLTTPYNKEYIDPEICGNDVIIYDTANSTFVQHNICDFLDNKNLLNGTNINKECKESRESGINSINDKNNEIPGNKCIANYGDTINSKYKDYVCKENEACIGYECGVKFGNCSPSLLE